MTVFDPTLQKDVVQSIQDAGMDYSARVEGTAITVSLPKVSVEHRNALVKQVKKHREDGKVAIRNQRKPALQVINKHKGGKGVSKDEVHVWQKELDNITNTLCAKLDKLAADKEAELLKD